MDKKAILTTIPSDAHSWNLIFMEMFLKEHGYNVINLGVCVSYEKVIKSCQRHRPEIVVVSTINGHGYFEGIELAEKLCFIKNSCKMKLVIGGKITTGQSQIDMWIDKLRIAGFDAVFCGGKAIVEFQNFLNTDGTYLISNIKQQEKETIKCTMAI